MDTATPLNVSTTPPATPPSSETQFISNPVTPPEKPSNLPKIIISVVILLLLAAFSGISYVFLNKQKAELTNLVNSQVTTFSALKNDYAAVEKIIKAGDNGTNQNSTPVPPSKTLIQLPKGKQIAMGDSNVLGIADEIQNGSDSQIIDKLTSILQKVDTIKRNNERIKKLATSTPLSPMILPKTSGITDETDTFIQQTEPLMTYIQEMFRFSKNSEVLGAQIGVSINSAIARNADAASLSQLKGYLDQIAEMKNEYIKIDTSKLPSKMQEEHLDELKQMDTDLKMFNDIYSALEKKDVFALRSALEALIYSAGTSSIAADTSKLNFWQTNETIKSIHKVSADWDQFKKDNI